MKIIKFKTNIFMLFILAFLIPLQGSTIMNKSEHSHHENAYLTNVANEYISSLPSYIPASPTASSLATYADYPVSHYTGVPDISIPLYEIAIDNLRLPISLSYHASGIKVSQEASWVGLGWALSAGGVISRTIKCADDFLEYSTPNIQTGYYNGPEANDPSSNSFYTYTYEGTKAKPILIADSEPDIFNYSLPGGSGKFLIDKSRGSVFFDKSTNIRVEVLTENNKKYFRLTNPDGIKYTFKDRETTRSYGREGYLNKNRSNATKFDEDIANNSYTYYENSRYTSSWYLSEIITPTNRTIIFTYTSESYQAPVQENCTKYNSIYSSGNSMCGPGNNIIYSCNKTIVESLRLSRISSDGGYVTFNSTSREDLIGEQNAVAPQKLSSLKVYNKNNSCIKNIELTYDYFNSTYQGSYGHVFKRLKLVGIKDASDVNNTHAFTYMDGTLPAKNSKNTDYWGYHNGKNYEDVYYCSAKYNNINYNGADKSARLAYTQIGSLQSARYPTGQLVTLTYEANKYQKSLAKSGTNIENIQKGFTVSGYYQDEAASYYPSYKSETITFKRSTPIEIRGWAENLPCQKDPNIIYGFASAYPTFKITKLSNLGNTIMLDFPVPTELETQCSYDFPYTTTTLPAGTYLFEAFGHGRDHLYSFTCKYQGEVETSTDAVIAEGGGLRIARIEGETSRRFEYPIGTLLIDPVTYYISSYDCFNGTAFTDNTSYLTQVSESTIPMYTLKRGNSIGYNSVKETSYYGSATYNFYNNREEESFGDYPFLPTVINYYNGLPSSIVYRDNRDNISKLIDYEYESAYSHKVYGFMFNSNSGNAYPYEYHIETPYKIKEEVIDYEDNGQVTTIKEYRYNNHLQMVSEYIRSAGEGYQREIVYPTDLTDAVSQNMVNKHLLNTPIENLYLKNGLVTMGKKTDYKDTLGILVPVKEYTIETKTPLSRALYRNYYVPQTTLGFYTSCGKPMYASNVNQSTVYLWSYNGMYPVAEISNASYQQVTQLLGSEFISTLYNKNAPSDSEMNTLNALRNNLPNAQITTFTYLPLIGISSITDPRNVTTYYTYDSSNRLSECYTFKSGVKEVLEHYDYHYYNK